MKLKNVKKYIEGTFSDDERKKAGQLLKMSPVVYCFLDVDGTIFGALRNSQNEKDNKIVRLKILETGTGEPAPECELCGAGRCFHSAVLLLHCERHENLFSEKVEKKEVISYSGLPAVSLKTFSKQAEEEGAGTRLEVYFPSGLPHLPTRWDNCVFGVRLFSTAREYMGNLGNLRQLHFKETIGAKLRISQFSLQERQIIRYLALNSEAEGNLLCVNSENMAEFFHSLSGFEGIFSGDKTVHINRAPAEPSVAYFVKSGKTMFRPAIFEGDRAVVAKNFHIIMGKSGCWIGTNGDYWWIPGTIDVSILRAFFRIEETVLGSEEAEKLLSQFPEKFFRSLHMEDKNLRKRHFSPIYQIKSGMDLGHILELNLLFDYDSLLLPPGMENIFHGKGRSFRRDKERETSLVEELLLFGFIRKSNEKNEFFLDNVEAAGVFVSRLVPIWIKAGAKVYFEADCGMGVPGMKISLEKVDSNWETVKFRYDIAAGDQELDWGRLVKICKEPGDYTRLEKGGITHIGGKLREFVMAVWDITRKDADSDVIAIPTACETFWNAKAADAGINLKGLDSHHVPSIKDSGDKIPPLKFFKGELRKYQSEGLEWMRLMISRKLNFILADEMGLGKTVQALALMASLKETSPGRKPFIVLCPSTLVENWQMEAERFVPELGVAVVKGALRGKEMWDKASLSDIIICSYSILKRDIEHCRGISFRCVFLDEAQHIKNPSTENAKSCKQLKSGSRIVLTGTPLENSPSELWSIFDFLHPGILGSLGNFKARYCADGAGAETHRELASRVGPFILRRKKAEVTPELPEKTEQLVFCDFEEDQKAVYDQILECGRNEYEKMTGSHAANRINVLSWLLRLRQLCCHPDLLPANLRPPGISSAKTELFKELLLESFDSGHRVLLFSQFTSLLKIIREWLDSESVKYEYLDGKTQDRMQRVVNFNSDRSIPVFLLSLKAGGTGLNLASADRVIIYDPWWNPAVEDQASDRAHRIGQIRNVSILKLVVKNSIEEKVIKLHEYKKQLFQNLVENASLFRKLSNKDIEFLLE